MIKTTVIAVVFFDMILLSSSCIFLTIFIYLWGFILGVVKMMIRRILVFLALLLIIFFTWRAFDRSATDRFVDRMRSIELFGGDGDEMQDASDDASDVTGSLDDVVVDEGNAEVTSGSNNNFDDEDERQDSENDNNNTTTTTDDTTNSSDVTTNNKQEQHNTTTTQDTSASLSDQDLDEAREVLQWFE